MTVLRPLTRAVVELWESVVNDPATRAPFDRFGFATAGGMRHRVENRETITDTRGQLAIADADGGFVGEVPPPLGSGAGEQLLAAGHPGAVGAPRPRARQHGAGLFKTELIRRRGPWRGLDHVELATLEWVDWFNNRRLHSACGDAPPVELERDHYRQIAALQGLETAEPSLH